MNIKKLSIILMALAFMWSCSDDSSNPAPGGNIPTPTVDPGDPTAVSTEMGSENPMWIEMAGTTPATNGAITQASNADNDTLPSTNGRSVAVDINVLGGDAGSIIFGIEGANAHYEVPADPDGRIGLIPNGSGNRNPWGARLVKKKKEMSRSGLDSLGYLFIFNIPSSIQPGMFCVRFALTNPAGDVSNYVTFCVRVSQRGGEGTAGFTSKLWKAEKYEDIYYDSAGNIVDNYTELYGVKEWDTSFYFLPCPGGGELEVEVIEWYIYDLFLNFKANGEFNFDGQEEFHEMDWELSDCTNVVYIDGSDEDMEIGGWSYDNTNMTMTLNWEGYYDEGGYYNSPYSETYPVVSQSANRFVLRVWEDLPYNEELVTFIPR